MRVIPGSASARAGVRRSRNLWRSREAITRRLVVKPAGGMRAGRLRSAPHNLLPGRILSYMVRSCSFVTHTALFLQSAG